MRVSDPKINVGIASVLRRYRVGAQHLGAAAGTMGIFDQKEAGFPFFQEGIPC